MQLFRLADEAVTGCEWSLTSARRQRNASAVRGGGPPGRRWWKSGDRTGAESRAGRGVSAAIAALVLVLTSACGSSDSDTSAAGLAGYPASPDGLRMIAEEFLKPGADVTALFVSLKPDEYDYPEIFRLDTVEEARKHYAGYWESPDVVGPATGQTEIRIESVTPEELVTGSGAAPEFAGGFRTVAPELAPGLTVHEIIFQRPSDTFGVRLDGLVHVNGKWRIVPAPWAVLSVNEPGHQH